LTLSVYLLDVLAGEIPGQLSGKAVAVSRLYLKSENEFAAIHFRKAIPHPDTDL
jgi:hypothetical protein